MSDFYNFIPSLILSKKKILEGYRTIPIFCGFPYFYFFRFLFYLLLFVCHFVKVIIKATTLKCGGSKARLTDGYFSIVHTQCHIGGFIVTSCLHFCSLAYELTHRRCSRIQLFRERLSEKVHATIPKSIVGSFEFTVLQRNLKEWHERPWAYVCEW